MCAGKRCRSAWCASGGSRSRTRGAPRGSRARGPDARAALGQAVERPLAQDPADRFARVAEFTAALEETRPGTVPSLVRRTPSIAVLPFVNASAAPENEYLSDGISDELITA